MIFEGLARPRGSKFDEKSDRKTESDLKAHFVRFFLLVLLPFWLPNGAQNVKKTEVKKQVVFGLDFVMVWRWFLIGFWIIFETKICQIC